MDIEGNKVKDRILCVRLFPVLIVSTFLVTILPSAIWMAQGRSSEESCEAFQFMYRDITYSLKGQSEKGKDICHGQKVRTNAVVAAAEEHSYKNSHTRHKYNWMTGRTVKMIAGHPRHACNSSH